MRIEKTPRFKQELEAVLDFIAEDSISRALEFYDALLEQIEEIPTFPYRHRKRIDQDDDHIRELIFKGYTIPYLIDEESGVIVVLGAFNQNQWSYP